MIDSILLKVHSPLPGLAIQNLDSDSKGYKLKSIVGSGRNQHYLRIMEVDNSGAFTIEGSLRKWCFGKSSFGDLNWNQVHDCLNMIVERLCIPRSYLMRATVLKVEIGRTILYSKPLDVKRLILKLEHLDVEDQWTYRSKDGSSVLFIMHRDKQQSIELKVYDKLAEINKKVRPNNPIHSTNNALIRLESAWTFYDGKVDLESVLEQWNECCTHLMWLCERLKFKLGTVLTEEELKKANTMSKVKVLAVEILADDLGGIRNLLKIHPNLSKDSRNRAIRSSSKQTGKRGITWEMHFLHRMKVWIRERKIENTLRDDGIDHVRSLLSARLRTGKQIIQVGQQ